MAKDYAKGILESIVQSEVKKLGNLELPPNDLCVVIKTNPEVELKPSVYGRVYSEEEVSWGINPSTLEVGDVVIMSRNPDSMPIVTALIDGQSPDPTAHETGLEMYENLGRVMRDTKSWKPYVDTPELLPQYFNFKGDIRLVLSENTFYRWDDGANQWNKAGSTVGYISDLLDVEITDPQTGDVLQWDGEKWINAPAPSGGTEDALPLAGGTMEGDITMPTGTMITLVDEPVEDTDAVNKFYVDELFAGLIGTELTLVPTALVTYDDSPFEPSPNDQALLVDVTDGPVTIQLPADHIDGKLYEIKDLKGLSASNNIIIITADSDTIDGSASYTINIALQSIVLVSDGSNWFIV